MESNDTKLGRGQGFPLQSHAVIKYHLIDGDLIDGDLIDGDLIDGDLIDGDLIDGDLIDGGLIDGVLIKGEVLSGVYRRLVGRNASGFQIERIYKFPESHTSPFQPHPFKLLNYSHL
jgi:hypothetical protein